MLANSYCQVGDREKKYQRIESPNTTESKTRHVVNRLGMMVKSLTFVVEQPPLVMLH